MWIVWSRYKKEPMKNTFPLLLISVILVSEPAYSDSEIQCTPSESAMHKEYDRALDDHPEISTNTLRKRYAKKFKISPEALRDLYGRCELLAARQWATQGRKKLSVGTPIEVEAVIDPRLQDSPEAVQELADFVTARGYKCDSISAASMMMFARGGKLTCNHYAHKYEIEDKGGIWQVTVK